MNSFDQTAEGWKTARMNKVDLTILRLAVYEMRWDDDVPEGVAINEAVELAKRFGGDSSSSFVNGVLWETCTSGVLNMKNVYTVRQVNSYIKNMFTQDFMLNRLYVKRRGVKL